MGEVTESLKIVIADDDPIYREGLTSLLEKYPDIEVVGAVGDGDQVLCIAEARKVNIVLLDLDMPIRNGISTAKVMQERVPNVKVIFLTAFQQEDIFPETIGRNVRGFLTKSTSVEQLISVIRQVSSGFAVFDERPAELLVEQYCETVALQPEYQQFRAVVEALPVYLRSVFDLLIKAKPNKQIAKELGLSEATVRSYIAEIFVLTNMESRGLLAITAVKAGY